MGGKSTSSATQAQNSTTTPWAPAQSFLEGILGQLNGGLASTGPTGAESGALNTVEANAGDYNQFSPAVTGAMQNYLNGGGATAQAPNLQAALNAYRAMMTPYASGSMIGTNSALKPQLQTIQDDVTNATNAQFAAAGRDMSPANYQAVARGVAQGEAPVIANQYNADTDRAINAAGSLYGAGNTTSGLLSGLQQQFLQNQGQGVGMIPTALTAQNAPANAILAAEAQRRGIPLQTLSLLANIGVPIAGLGRQSSGTNVSEGQNQMSGAQQFATIAGGLGDLTKLLFSGPKK